MLLFARALRHESVLLAVGDVAEGLAFLAAILVVFVANGPISAVHVLVIVAPLVWGVVIRLLLIH